MFTDLNIGVPKLYFKGDTQVARQSIDLRSHMTGLLLVTKRTQSSSKDFGKAEHH